MDVFLGGSRSQGPDTSGASPSTLAAVNYIDAVINGGDFSPDVPAKLVVWGAVSAGSLEVRLYEVNEDLSLGTLFATDSVPFTSAVEAKHEITLPAWSGIKTFRLMAVLTGGVDEAVWFLGVVRGEAITAEEFPADCVPLQTALCNKALGYIGVTELLVDVEDDTTIAAVMSRLYLAGATKECLRGFSWAFATEYADLTWVDGSAAEPANIDWTYAYRLPADCVKLRRVAQRGLKRQGDPNVPAFREGKADDAGRIVFSDYYDPESADLDEPTLPVEYTKSLGCTLAVADELFVEALAWLMAMKLAPSLSRNKLTAADCRSMHLAKIREAKTEAANEQQRQRPDDHDIDPGWIRDRA